LLVLQVVRSSTTYGRRATFDRVDELPRKETGTVSTEVVVGLICMGFAARRPRSAAVIAALAERGYAW
jgi:hypothetical protein